MIPIAVILEALRREPVYYGDRAMDPAERETTVLVPVAEALAPNVRDKRELARMLALGRAESGWASYVVRGHCSDGPRGARCDNLRSRSPWQIRSWCRKAWAVAEDDPAMLQESAACAVRMLRYQADRGKEHALTPDHAAFSGYGARPWNWPGADARVKTMKTILARLERGE